MSIVTSSHLHDGSAPDTGTAPAPSPNGRRRRRVAIVGAGMIAAVHRRSALLAGAELVGVLASTPARSAIAAETWQAGRGFADIDEVATSDADVVHICSPNATHAPYVERVLAAGKHVVCEKPLGVTLAEAEAMTAAAADAGVVATVPFVYRYHPVVREIRSRVDAGDFGTWNLLHGQYLQDWLLSAAASNWRVDPRHGGASRAFADIGSHWCDLVEWVSGQRIATLVAQTSIAVAERPEVSGPSFSDTAGGASVGVATEDSATVVFRTTEGVIGSVVVSQIAAGRKNRLWFELDGARSSVVFDQEHAESFWTGEPEGSRTVVRDPGQGSDAARRLSYLPAGHAQGYADCFDAFVADTYAAMDGDRVEGLPTFVDGARAARIVDAVLRSAATSRWTEM